MPEEDQLRDALQRATSKAEEAYTSTQLDPRRKSIPLPERRRRLKAAIHELGTAQVSWDSVKERNNLVTDFIRGTFDYVSAKKDASRHDILVQWVLDQVPLVEAELA